MLYGLLNLSFWGYVIALLILTHITIVTVTVYLHRAMAHRALDLHPALSHFFRFWTWLTTGMVVKEWIAIHRKHHAKCETEDDPHSPQILGIRKVLWQGAELYRKECKNKADMDRYGHAAPDDWLERHVYTPYSVYGIILMLIINLVLFGIPGITIWAIQMLWIPFWAAGVINGIGHYWGYRNFECPDAARNIVPWGILIGGEELHNNHHTFGTSAKFSVKWWEFDLGWGYIRLFEILGLAKVRKVPPKLHQVPGKSSIDDDTLTVVITNRFQVLSRYTKEVMLPVLRDERVKAGESGKRLYHRAKHLLVSDPTLVDADGKQHIERILEENKSLHEVYAYREKLREIWGRTTASQKELIEALQEWCRQAEATGLQALRDFVKHLKSYAPQAA